jgi:dTDP-glucose 4,6-dehydratase
MRVCLTGASGFVGSHVLRHLLAVTGWDIVCPVSFRHRGVPARITSAADGIPDMWARTEIVYWDMRAPADPVTLAALDGCEVFLNIAAESHVDRSIADPTTFVQNNVAIMLNALDAARQVGPRLFLQMSTDEVYGPAAPGVAHREWDPVVPSNPYSASKAAQEAVAVAYWRTYAVPVVITNTMNIIGEMQHPEKFLPMVIRNLRDGRPVPVHTDTDGTPGSRHYLHARNLADAWLHLIRRYTGGTETVRTLGGAAYRIEPGPPMYSGGAPRPARFHIAGEEETDNRSLVHMVGKVMGLDAGEVDALIKPVSFHATRPGHDLRYALNADAIARTGWTAPLPLRASLESTVRWSLDHPQWLDL